MQKQVLAAAVVLATGLPVAAHARPAAPGRRRSRIVLSVGTTRRQDRTVTRDQATSRVRDKAGQEELLAP